MSKIPETRDRSQLKYWGFISYSHRDKKIAKKIQKILESFQIPKEHVGKPCPAGNGTIPQRLRPFFRDEDELPTSVNLKEPIQAALQNSKSLIVVCSPRSAASKYVDIEVLSFKQLSQDERWSCVIIDGIPNISESVEETHPDECFCPSLRYQLGQDGELSDIKAEPLGAAVENTSIEQEAVRVIASITGLAFGELWKRFERDRIRRRRFWTTGILVILTIIASISFYGIQARIDAKFQKIQAESQKKARRAAQYTGLISFSEKEYARGEFESARRNLSSCSKDLRDWEWYYLNQMFNPATKVLSFPDVRLETVDVSANEKFIAAGTSDGRIVIWDRISETIIKVLEHENLPERVRKRGDVSPVKSVKFSPDGKKLLSLSVNGRLVIWNTKTFIIQKTLAENNSTATCWLPGSKDIVRLSGSRLSVWDTEKNTIKKTMNGVVNSISSISISKNGRLLTIADSTSKVRVWDTQTGRLRQQFENSFGGVFSVAIQPEGNYVAGGTESGTIFIWRMEKGTEIARLKGHSSYVNGLDWKVNEISFDNFEERLASCGEDGTVKIWEPIEQKLLITLRGHEQPASDVTWSPSGDFAVSCSGDGTVRSWIPSTAAEAETLPGRFVELRSLFVAKNGIIASVETPFASAPNRPIGNIELSEWSLNSPSKSRTFGDPKAGHAVALDKRDSKTIGLFEDGNIHVWDSKTQKHQVSQESMPGTPIGFGIAQNGNNIATCNSDGELWIWDFRTLRVIHRWKHHTSKITRIKTIGSDLITADSDGKIQFWNWTNGRIENEIIAHKGAILDLCIDAQRELICSSGTDGNIVLNSSSKHQILEQFNLWIGPPESLAMHPNGQRIAAGHADGSISLWDLQGTLQLVLRGHSKGVRHLQFSPDGTNLVSASEDGTIRLWRALQKKQH